MNCLNLFGRGAASKQAASPLSFNVLAGDKKDSNFVQKIVDTSRPF